MLVQEEYINLKKAFKQNPWFVTAVVTTNWLCIREMEGTLIWYTHGDMSELPKLLSSSWESFSISREYLFNTCQWGTQLDTAERTALGCKWAQRLLPACREYAGTEACCLGWITFNFALTIYLIILFSTDLLQKANRILIHFRQSECWSIYYGAEL